MSAMLDRTRAILAAHDEHPEWTSRDIAAHVGCKRETVTRAASRYALSLPPVVVAYRPPPKASSNKNLAIRWPGGTAADRLRWHARTRRMSVDELCSRLIEVIGTDDMVDAVLDDVSERARAA